MQRLRLTAGSLKVVAEWSAAAPHEYRQRAAELLRSIDDGSWQERWWWRQISSAPDVMEVALDQGISVFMTVYLDEADTAFCADIFTIAQSG